MQALPSIEGQSRRPLLAGQQDAAGDVRTAGPNRVERAGALRVRGDDQQLAGSPQARGVGRQVDDAAGIEEDEEESDSAKELGGGTSGYGIYRLP